MRIGLMSDTHGYIDPKIYKHFKEVDEIWHAGDIGDLKTADELESFKPLRAVYGNIDDHEVRTVHPLHQRFDANGLDVWMTHIGGYPGRYSPPIRDEIRQNPPGLFISGHSHILKVQFDKSLNLLHLNPGACGNKGFHKIKTIMRFEIEVGKPTNLEVIELGPR